MADIELVVKLPKEQYDLILKSDIGATSVFVSKECMMYSIKNATPLPKGHGRIMDVDKVIKKMEEREEQLKDNRSMYETACVETALDMFGETIIEADKEKENVKTVFANAPTIIEENTEHEDR